MVVESGIDLSLYLRVKKIWAQGLLTIGDFIYFVKVTIRAQVLSPVTGKADLTVDEVSQSCDED
ncbi:hypothetical protein GCM10027567_13510 [Spongiibacter taiwanensis]